MDPGCFCLVALHPHPAWLRPGSGAHHFCHILLIYMISVLHSYTGLRDFGKLAIFVSSGRKFYCSSISPCCSISVTAQHVLNINWVALMWAFGILSLLL